MEERRNKPIGKVSVEALSHFRCGECNKWWSMGDVSHRDEWFCPWCGLKQSFKDVTPKDPTLAARKSSK